jgi:hypothetical protein
MRVLEHVFNPDEFLGEIVRVLKYGRKLLLTVPLEKHGLKIIHLKKIHADASILFQLANA